MMKKIVLLNSLVIMLLIGATTANAQQIATTTANVYGSPFINYSDTKVEYYFVDSTQYGLQKIKQTMLNNWEQGVFSLGTNPVNKIRYPNSNIGFGGWSNVPYTLPIPYTGSNIPINPNKYYLVMYATSVLGDYKLYSINKYSSYFYADIPKVYFFKYQEIPNTVYSTPYTITGVEENNSLLQVKAKGTILTVNAQVAEGVLEVYDMQGIKIAHQSFTGSETNIQLPKSTGVYIVKLISNDKVYTQKLTLN